MKSESWQLDCPHPHPQDHSQGSKFKYTRRRFNGKLKRRSNITRYWQTLDSSPSHSMNRSHLKFVINDRLKKMVQTDWQQNTFFIVVQTLDYRQRQKFFKEMKWRLSQTRAGFLSNFPCLNGYNSQSITSCRKKVMAIDTHSFQFTLMWKKKGN